MFEVEQYVCPAWNEYHLKWYVFGPRGYLWPDGMCRSVCIDTHTMADGYYSTREDAESAAMNCKIGQGVS